MPSNQIPTPSAVQRNINKISSTLRNQIADELNAFLELDKINYTNLKESLLNNKKDSVCPVVAFWDENILTVQSSKFVDGILLFMLRIYNNLWFETFHYGFKCFISSLSKNYTNTVDTMSKLEEIIWYLNSMAFDLKKNILSQQFLAMASKIVGIKYSSDIVIPAFEYYTTSWALYNRLRDNFQLPSLAKLGRMMSKVSKLNKKSFLLSIFNTLITSQKGCIILHDEVYIKKQCYIMANSYLVNQLTIHLYLLKQYLV